MARNKYKRKFLVQDYTASVSSLKRDSDVVSHSKQSLSASLSISCQA